METQNQKKGARILKHGLLASPTSATITGPAVIGNFGKYDVPFDLEGQRFILPMSANNPEFVALREAFGEPSEWEGCTVALSDGKILRQVSIRPVADANQKPVH